MCLELKIYRKWRRKKVRHIWIKELEHGKKRSSHHKYDVISRILFSSSK